MWCLSQWFSLTSIFELMHNLDFYHNLWIFKKCKKIARYKKIFFASFYTPWGHQEPNLVRVRLLCYKEHRQTQELENHHLEKMLIGAFYPKLRIFSYFQKLAVAQKFLGCLSTPLGVSQNWIWFGWDSCGTRSTAKLRSLKVTILRKCSLVLFTLNCGFFSYFQKLAGAQKCLGCIFTSLGVSENHIWSSSMVYGAFHSGSHWPLFLN